MPASTNTTQARDFTVVQLTVAPPVSLKTDTLQAPGRPSVLTSSQVPALVVVGALVYFATMLWSVVTSSARDTSSDPFVWTLCVPYTIVMIFKFLTRVRAMEALEEGDLVDQLEQGDRDAECEAQFGDDASDDVIAVVGDVCIYVIGILVLSYWFLPWQLYVE